MVVSVQHTEMQKNKSYCNIKNIIVFKKSIIKNFFLGK